MKTKKLMKELMGIGVPRNAGRERRRAAGLYLTSLLQMMHDERGFGAERLGKLFEPVAAEIRWYVEKFFLGTDVGDAEIKKKIDAVHKKLEGHGLELVQVPASDAVAIRKKESKPKEIPAGLENLAWDKIKDQNTFISGVTRNNGKL